MRLQAATAAVDPPTEAADRTAEVAEDTGGDIDIKIALGFPA
jgi:hypothetical protein